MADDAPTPEDTNAMTEIVTWAEDGQATEFPPTLQAYFEVPDHQFKVLPPLRDIPPNHVCPFEIQFQQKIVLQFLRRGTEVDGHSNRIYSYVVGMVQRVNGKAIETFPAGSFVTVNLLQPEARMVVTVQLSGCSFVIGQDKTDKNVLYLGHAQPSSGDDRSHSEELKKHFKSAKLDNVFEGKQLSKVKVIGGYGMEIVYLLGWITGGKLIVFVKTDKTFSHMEFPYDFDKHLVRRLMHSVLK